jgi:hypothetical protein
MKRYLFLVLSSITLFFFIYPSAFLSSNTSLPDTNDTRLISYIIGQVQQNITLRQPLFYGTFFAPDTNTLSYSDAFITTSLITLPFRLLTSSPIVIFNISLILGFVLTFMSAYILFDYIFQNTWLNIITTLLLTLSGYHFSYLPHLQMFNIWSLLLSIYFYLRFQKENNSHFLTLFFITVTLQLVESIFPVYLIFFTTFILFLQKPSQIKKILSKLLFFIPLWIILIFPYLKLHFTFPEAKRSIHDAAHFSLGLEEVFTKYHGTTSLVIFILSSLFVKGISAKSKSWWFLFTLSLLMSLGPVIKIFGNTLKVLGLPIPLPYFIFYYLFPGFTGFRTPSRFIILTLLAITIISGYSLQKLFVKLKTKTKITVSLLILSLLLYELSPPITSYPVDITPPQIYQQVSTLPANSIILELPIKLWNDKGHEIESIRSIYSLSHRHRRFGGFSGFATNHWIETVQKINEEGLNQENINTLKLLGVTHVVERSHLTPLP